MRLHVDHRGPAGGARVVLVHGSMDRSASFGRVVRLLGDLHVVRYDRRGYGRSHAVPVVSGLEVHVEDLLGVLDDEPSTVFGHSYGAVVALAAAARAPGTVLSVLAFEPPTPWLAAWPAETAGTAAMARVGDPPSAAEAFMRAVVGDAVWERLPEATRSARRAEGPALLAELGSLSERPPFPPRAVSCPVVVAHGTETGGRFQRAAAHLAAVLPAAVLCTAAGAGHGAHLSHPAEVAGLIRLAVDRA